MEGTIRYTTGQLQAPTSKALAVGRGSWRRRREFNSLMRHLDINCLLACSSVVEQSAVNRLVVGSIPTLPAIG